MSMFRTPTSQRSFSELPLENVGNIMSYLPSKERARVATVTGSFLPVSEGYYGRGSRTEMHREYMYDRKLENERNIVANAVKNRELDQPTFDVIFKSDNPMFSRIDIEYYIGPAIASCGLIETLKMLVDQGRINLAVDGIEILYCVIYYYISAVNKNRFKQCLEVLNFILKKGVNPNNILYGSSPIIKLVLYPVEIDIAKYFQPSIEIIKTLLQYGADPTIRTYFDVRTIETLENMIEPLNQFTRDDTASAVEIVTYLTEGPFVQLQDRNPKLYQFLVECRDLFTEWILRTRYLPSLNWVGRDYQAYGLSKRKTSRRKTSKRKTPKRKTSKRKTPKRKTSKRKTSRATKRR